MAARIVVALSPAQVQSAIDTLKGATFLSPDTDPDYFRALLLSRTGRVPGAVILALSVVRREPDNLKVWNSVHGLALQGHRPRLAARARTEFRRLDPADARGR